MFRENQTLWLSSRAKREIRALRTGTQNRERFAFGWRSAFSAAICALQSQTALAPEVIKANFSESPQILVQKRRKNSFSKVCRAVASRALRQRFSLLCETRAAALIEFAVALPLLIVLVVGIFDFGGAFNLKQELNNAVREGARFGASQPTNDLALIKPPSVDAVRYLVAAYLQAARINACGLDTMPQPASGGGLTWVYTTTGTCPSTLQLTIQRTCLPSNCPTITGPPNAYLPYTYVKISYPYQWHFNNVIQLLVPGANLALSSIMTDAAAANMD